MDKSKSVTVQKRKTSSIKEKDKRTFKIKIETKLRLILLTNEFSFSYISAGRGGLFNVFYLLGHTITEVYINITKPMSLSVRLTC